MNEPSDERTDRSAIRAKIMGLGERAIRKSYYPQLQARIRELEEKSTTLVKMRDALQHAHDTLERRVEERTAELAASNRKLEKEIVERKRVEDALRESRKQLKSLSSQLVRDQERERKRIANEIHDRIGQPLHAVKIGVAGLRRRDDALAKGEKSLDGLLSMIDFVIEEVRNIYTGLRPSLLDDLGILAAVNWFLREFKKAYPDIGVEEQISIQEERVPEPIKTVIFRVLQATLDNVARHGRAKTVHISLQEKGDGIWFMIRDDGVGFDLEDASFGVDDQMGLGLATMQEQVESSGGIFTVKSVKGVGTIVRVHWRIRGG